MPQKYIKELFKSSIKEIEAIDRLAKMYQLEDSQEYLNWKDALNYLSIDADR